MLFIIGIRVLIKQLAYTTQCDNDDETDEIIRFWIVARMQVLYNYKTLKVKRMKQRYSEAPFFQLAGIVILNFTWLNHLFSS